MYDLTLQCINVLFFVQIWRPITATFFFPVGPGTGFLYLVNLYFLYQYSSRLETGMLSIMLYANGKLSRVNGVLALPDRAPAGTVWGNCGWFRKN